MNSKSKTIIIADSGSTKTDWVSVDCDFLKSLSLLSDGINPYYQTFEEILLEIENNVYPVFKNYDVRAIYFYGAGCNNESINSSLRKALEKVFRINSIYIESDIVGAARSLCGKNSGIVSIMGTGSNSCQWDGEKIVAQVSPLGFIMGDEGSGAVLGRSLVADILKNQLPKDIVANFFDKYNLTPSDILNKVYKEPFPNRFLAGFSPFILENISSPSIRRIVYDSFVSFVRRNIKQYNSLPVHFVGSIAYLYSDILSEVAHDEGITIASIERSPINALVQYHIDEDIAS